jgi:hypothetical protein
MKNRSLILGAMAAISMIAFWSASGEPAPTPEPLPKGPLLKRAPDAYEWEIRVDTEESAKPPQEGKAPPPPPPKTVVVTKGGKVVREVIAYANGAYVEIWHRGGASVTKSRGNQSWSVSPDSSGGFESPDYVTSDFSGLEWISPNTFTGIQSLGGRKVIVFTGSVCDKGATDLAIIRNGVDRQRAEEALSHKPLSKAFDPKDYKVPAIAYIDLESRLPLMLKYGNLTRSYHYRAPSQSTLTLPPDAVQAVTGFEQYKASLSRGPAAP